MTIHEGPVGAAYLDLPSWRFAASLDPEGRLPHRFLSCAFSLATTASWKDENSQYTDKTKRTDWHRCIAWSNLSKFAGTLKKGAHIEVEGQLCYRQVSDRKNRDVKYALAEVHVSRILKLDRPEKHNGGSGPPDQPDGLVGREVA